MYTFKAQNKYGQQIELTHNDAYVIESIDGLDPPDGVINTTRNANDDGSVYNSSYVDNRTITITMAINAPAEQNRINLYTYFKTKMPVRLYYANETRNVYIDGYVKSMQIGFFDKKQIVQIIILCPKPFFNSVDNEVIDFSSVELLFEFPFAIEETGIEFSSIILNQEKSIINYGDVETGLIFNIYANGTVINPAIYNTETNEYFILNITMSKGDVITINTKKKEKSVTLLSDGITTNIIGNMKEGSTWFQLVSGNNLFTTTAEEYPENMNIYCILTNQFEGV